MIKLNDVEIKLNKYPDGTFLFKDTSYWTQKPY